MEIKGKTPREIEAEAILVPRKVITDNQMLYLLSTGRVHGIVRRFIEIYDSPNIYFQIRYDVQKDRFEAVNRGREKIIFLNEKVNNAI